MHNTFRPNVKSTIENEKQKHKPNMMHIVSFKTYGLQNTLGLNMLLEMIV